MAALFEDEALPTTKVVRNVIDHADLKPGRYRVGILSELRPFTGSIVVDVLRVYDDETVDLRVVESRYLVKGSQSNVPLSWQGGRRVFSEIQDHG